MLQENDIEEKENKKTSQKNDIQKKKKIQQKM